MPGSLLAGLGPDCEWEFGGVSAGDGESKDCFVCAGTQLDHGSLLWNQERPEEHIGREDAHGDGKERDDARVVGVCYWNRFLAAS